MYVWLVCFVVLFGLAELYLWVQGFALPFPVMLLAGVGLAIASNLNKWGSSPVRPPSPLPHVPPATAPLASGTTAVADSASISPPPKRSPVTAPAAADSISFTIRKSGANRES